MEACRCPLFVHQHFYLLALELYTSVSEALLTQDSRQTVEFADSRSYISAKLGRGLVAINDGLCLFVIQTSIGTDDSAADLELEHLGFAVHREDDGHRQFVLVRTERAKEITQTFGQHGYRSVHQINRCATVICLAIQQCAGLHVVRHIGDVHTYLVLIFACAAEGERVVKILGIKRVDGER